MENKTALTNFFTFDCNKHSEALNLWQTGFKAQIDLCEHHIIYVESMSEKIGKHTKDFCKIRIDTGKVFYPAYPFDVFVKMHMDFLIEYYGSVGYIPIPTDN